MATATMTRPAMLTTGGTTELDAVLTGVPWGDGYDFAKGLDAVTGSLMPSAIEPAKPVETTVKKSHESYRFVQSESELDTEIETAVSGKYNFSGVTVSGSSSYLQKIKFSELAISLVASYTSEYDGYDEIQQPQLTAQAKGLIGDHAKFRHQYGDYFVKGAKRGSTFYAVYVCQSRSVSNMSEFKAKLGAETPKVFSAEGSARFMQAASEKGISISVDVWMDGYEGVPPTPDKWSPDAVLAALKWFKEHEKGLHLRAELMHYSALDPSYPRTVDIAPEVFVALRKLYTALWTVRALYASCPATYQRDFTDKYNDLINEVTARQSALATDEALRTSCQQRTDALRSGLTVVFDRMVFVSKVRDSIGTEPGGGHVTEDSGRRSYFYGYSQYPRSAAVSIKSASESYSDVWQIGYREHVFDMRREDWLIVGWEVVSNWADGTNGWWRQDSAPILLSKRANVYVKSWYDRGCNWTLNVWYVDAKDYDFS